MLILEIAIVLALIVVNGLLSMSELAVVSSRPARLKTMVDRGVLGSRRALALASDPGRFLSGVQIGITLVGILSGAFSGATIGLRLTEWLAALGVPPGIANALGVGVVVSIITYASLVAGELVPKQIALRNPEGVAVKVAPAMTVIAKIASPLVWLLDASGKMLLRILGQHVSSEDRVTDEEIRTIIAEAETAGVIEPAERQMISGVMRLGDRPVKGVMTPRTDVDWINLTEDDTTIREKLIRTQHSRIPVADGEVDAMIGVVHVQEILAALLEGKRLDIAAHIRTAPVVPDSADALDTLEVLRTAEVPVALVHDEYGHFEGIVTPADLLEAIAGVFHTDKDDNEPAAVRREDGSWLLAGAMPADEMADLLNIPLPEERGYETLAGFLLSQLQHLPATGEIVDAYHWRFEVVDMDGRRIDKVLATRLPVTHRA
jgi:putative hemolysin